MGLISFFYPRNLQFKGKIRQLDFKKVGTGEGIIEFSDGSRFKLVALNSSAAAFLYAKILQFLTNSKNKKGIIIKDSVKGWETEEGIHGMESRHVELDAGFELVVYDVP